MLAVFCQCKNGRGPSPCWARIRARTAALGRCEWLQGQLDLLEFCAVEGPVPGHTDVNELRPIRNSAIEPNSCVRQETTHSLSIQES